MKYFIKSKIKIHQKKNKTNLFKLINKFNKSRLLVKE